MALWITAMHWPQTDADIGLPHAQQGAWEAGCFPQKAVGVKIGKPFHTAFIEGNSFPRNDWRVAAKVAQFDQLTGLESIAGLGMERANTMVSFRFLLQEKST